MIYNKFSLIKEKLKCTFAKIDVIKITSMVFITGKGGMTSSERAAQNTPSRPSTMSSQFAAIRAATERDDDSPSPAEGGIKGKLDNIKTEEGDAMDIKQEDSESRSESGGKCINNDIKHEIKSEPMDENDIKDEIKREVKEEPSTPDSSVDIKPSVGLSAPGSMDIMPSAGSTTDKKWTCSKFYFY